MPDDFSPEAFRRSLVLDDDVRYMNIGTSGPAPRRSLEAQCDFLARFSRRGPGSLEAFRLYLKAENEIRDHLAAFFGGEASRYVLTQSTCDGINIAINGFPWQAGDELITTDLEHSGLALPVYHRARRGDVRLRILTLSDGRSPLEALDEVLNPRTRLLALSHIAYCNGQRLPLAALIERAHEAGVAVLLDAAQSAGQIPVRWDDLGADFVSLPGQKWLLGPEGTGALYLHGEWVERLCPDRVGWAGDAGFDTAGGYTLKPTSARFETGTRDPAAWIAWSTSLELLEGYGIDALAERIETIARRIRQGLSEIPGVELIGPGDDAATSALIAFRVREVPPPEVVRQLWSREKIVARWIPDPHPPAVRVSCGAFVTDEEVEILLETIRGL